MTTLSFYIFLLLHLFACSLSQGPGRLSMDETTTGLGIWWPGPVWLGEGFGLQVSHSHLSSSITPVGK